MADKLFRDYFNEKVTDTVLPVNAKVLIQDGTGEPTQINAGSISIGQLVKITENGKTGYRLKDADPSNYGDIGIGAVDLSISAGASTTKGATGQLSHASGFNTTASGNFAKASGNRTTSSGNSSHASGSNTNASGDVSHAEGNGTTASGNNSHAEGGATVASGEYSHVEGDSNFARSLAEHSGGVNGTDYTPQSAFLFNLTDRLVNYGNGTSASNRSDAYTLFKNGMQKFFTAALSTITNAVKGSVMLDENARLNIHDGSVWRKVASINPAKIISASTYTLLVTDVDFYLEFSGACVVTLPLGFAASIEFQGEQTGTGEVSFVSAATGTLNKFADFDNKTAGQFAPFGIRTKGSNVATLIGTLKLA